jgi:hypothetical protein
MQVDANVASAVSEVKSAVNTWLLDSPFHDTPEKAIHQLLLYQKLQVMTSEREGSALGVSLVLPLLGGMAFSSTLLLTTAATSAASE